MLSDDTRIRLRRWCSNFTFLRKMTGMMNQVRSSLKRSSNHYDATVFTAQMK